ncbi:MAG: AraC family transcriptional regulator, partial [Comamonadaceae bacterium]
MSLTPCPSSDPRLRPVAGLLYDGVMSLDVAGPMQVFATANDERRGHGLPPAYGLTLLADQPGPIRTSAGFSLSAEQALADVDAATLDTVLVPGGDGVIAQMANADLLQWLRAAEPRVRRLGSVCSGALLLAEAGLLDGQRATTHWSRVGLLRSRHPAVQVDGDCLHTYDAAHPQASHLFTSAGVTAGIDLALALVEADLGRPLALAVARRLVMFLRRPGGQAQFSRLLAPELRHAPRLAALLEWMPGQIGGDLSLDALAAQACMPPRTLSRVFQRELGVSPGVYVE